MKTYEKIITILITLALSVCLYLTGLSVFRTALRYTPGIFRNITQHSSKADPSSSAKGFCGNNLTWRFADGILTISGSGRMKDYSHSDAPWAALSVTTVNVREGVTGIGARAFSRNSSVKHVLLPSTLTAIESDAFAPEKELPDIYVAQNNTRFTSFSGMLFQKGGATPAIFPSKNRQSLPCPAPAAIRQITSCILYILLYVQAIY